MTNDLSDDLPHRISRLLRSDKRPNGRLGQQRFSAEHTFGRHFGAPKWNARSASVLILILQRNGQWRIPLTLRPSHMKNHGGQVSLPGGMLEPGESSQAAAFREFQEELGCPTDRFELLGKLTGLYLYNSNFTVTPWIAFASEPPCIVPNTDEVAEYFELPLTVLFDTSAVISHRVRRGALKFDAPCFLWEEFRIWGATSMILGELADLLRAC